MIQNEYSTTMMGSNVSYFFQLTNETIGYKFSYPDNKVSAICRIVSKRQIKKNTYGSKRSLK